MARVVKEYTVRRGEILDSAQRLVYSKGYEQMTIQDILDDLHIAKGTFFHYFASKQQLLEALIERTIEQAVQLLTPIVDDASLPALEKLQSFFATANRWKVAQKSYFLALLRVWYTDDNAIVRQKMFTASSERLTPMLIAIVYQGVQEGVFLVSSPDQVGEVILSLMLGLGESYSRTLLSLGSGADLERLESMVAAFTEALERVLGTAPGAITLIDRETMREWTIPEYPVANGELTRAY